jgi:hypothetical protein
MHRSVTVCHLLELASWVYFPKKLLLLRCSGVCLFVPVTTAEQTIALIMQNHLPSTDQQFFVTLEFRGGRVPEPLCPYLNFATMGISKQVYEYKLQIRAQKRITHAYSIIGSKVIYKKTLNHIATFLTFFKLHFLDKKNKNQLKLVVISII